MEITQRNPDSLTPYKGNPRRISKSAISAVAASIKKYGFQQPIVVDADSVVIAGHTRLLAAKKLGIKSVPVHVADLTPSQAKAYRLADNRTSEFSVWDDEALTLELEELSESMGRDLSEMSEMTAFETIELERLLGSAPGLTDPDVVPEPPDDPLTKPGGLLELGKHRIMCGDSTKPADVNLLLKGAEPRLMVTDPPYGVEYDPDWRDRAGKGGKGRAVGRPTNDDKGRSWMAAWQLFPGDVAYVWHGWMGLQLFLESFTSSGLELRYEIVWAKNHSVISRGRYHGNHESCFYFVRKGCTDKWRGGRKQTTLWKIDFEMKLKTGHSNQKPVECMERPMRNHAGDVYDPFCGSGTSLIAAERQGITCYAMEIEPAYVDVAVKRWEAYTGQKALSVPPGGGVKI